MKKSIRVFSIIILMSINACSKSSDFSFSKPIIYDPPPPESEQQAEGSNGSSDQQMDDRTQYFDGSGKLYQKMPSSNVLKASNGGGFSLSFTNADIRTVISAVIGDIYGLPYSIHPEINGTISLETAGPVEQEAIFQALETSLKLKGIAIVPTETGYQIVPLAIAPATVSGFYGKAPGSAEMPGFSVQIIPLKFASPIEMRKILEPFAPTGGVLKVDEARRLLILAGTSQELATMRQVINTFDLDWMAGMSFALYDLKYVDSETAAKELMQIFGDAQSPLIGAVRLIPIPRINKILGISARKEFLHQVEDWITRLDIGGETPGRRIYVFHIQNGRAQDMARALGSILGGDSSNSGKRPVQRNPVPPSADAGLTPFTPTTQTEPEPIEAVPSVFENGGIRIVPDIENNALLILAQPSEYAVIENALRQMDIEPRQVLIEAALAEVTLTDDLRYGIQWDFTPGDNQVTLSQAPSGMAVSEFPGFSYIYSGASNVRLVLNALEEKTDVNIISYPKLLALNNQEATLQIGDEVPVPIQSATSVVDSNAPIINSIQYRETGVILKVVPRINAGGLVLLDITQEVSDVVSTTSSGIDAPTIQQRKVTTTIAVRDGQTIALGGLIRETQSRTKSGVPLLQDIPGLGNLFRKNNTVKRRTELVILLTPRVISNTEETREVMNYLRDVFVNVLPPLEAGDDENKK